MQNQTVKFFSHKKKSDSANSSNDNQAWSVDEVETLFNLPFADLMFRAQQVHRENFDPNEVQLSTLLSIKTGGCSEDCSYCTQ